MRRGMLGLWMLMSCGEAQPVQFQVVNTTGGELWIDLIAEDSTWGYEAQSVVVPVEGGLIQFDDVEPGAKRFDVRFQIDGAYVIDTFVRTGFPKEVNQVEVGEELVNAIHVKVDNASGKVVEALYFDHGTVREGERPGKAFGPIGVGETHDLSLLGDAGSYTYVVHFEGGTSSTGRPVEVVNAPAGSDAEVTIP